MHSQTEWQGRSYVSDYSWYWMTPRFLIFSAPALIHVAASSLICCISRSIDCSPLLKIVLLCSFHIVSMTTDRNPAARFAEICLARSPHTIVKSVYLASNGLSICSLRVPSLLTYPTTALLPGIHRWHSVSRFGECSFLAAWWKFFRLDLGNEENTSLHQ